MALLVPVLACGGTQPADPEPSAPPVATRLEVWPAAVRLFALGDETLLTARVLDRQGNVLEGQPVSWSTDDPSVAAVDGAGLVTAAGNGSATVTAASGGLDGTAAVAVTQQATRVEVAPVPDTLRRYGDTVRVAVRAFDANGHPAPASALEWTTSDSTVAAVDGTGLVTAVGNGSATISAGPGETAAVEVVVHDREAEDRAALLALRQAIGPRGLERRGWDPSKSISTWWGVTTEEEGRATRVVELSLPDEELGGPLPRELGRLRSLRVLHLQGNRITSVPREVGMLPNLESLRLDRTSVEGIPGPLPSLKVLNLAKTRIGSAFSLGHLPNLTSLDLSGNDLLFFPGNVFEMRDLEVLNLNGHWFTGQIPPELADLENLRVLGLAGSRGIPGMAGHHGMDSTIPPELGKLANLEELYLGGNRLRGTIPSELGDLANLRVLNLSGSYLARGQPRRHPGLEGSIPPELGKLADLEELWLNGHQLTGQIPPELGNLSNLKQLWLRGNELSGLIPPELGNLSNLKELWLNSNQMTGPILGDLGDLSNLEKLSLGHNELTGSVPPELGRLAKLVLLSLPHTKVSGPLPETFGDLASLSQLNVDYTRMEGRVPRAATRMTALRYLSMPVRLCVPRDSAFDAWLAAMHRFTGTRCRN